MNNEDKIDYNQFYDVNYKELKSINSKWIEKIKPKEKCEKKKGKIKSYKPYKRSIFIKFTYDYVERIFPYPLNCIILSLILIPIFLLPYYFSLGSDIFLGTDTIPGLITGTTFMMILVLLPISLIVMKQIFNKYEQTFKDLRSIAMVDNADYQTFISVTNSSLQSKRVYIFWIITWILVIALGIYQYINPTALDLIDDAGIFALVGGIIVYIITFTVTINISWYLIIIVFAIRRFCKMPLDIKPLDPDKAAGLKPLSTLSFNMAMISLLGIAGLIYGIVFGIRSITEPSSFLFLIGLIIMMIILFILPLANAHKIMSEKKTEVLTLLSSQHGQVFNRIKEKIPKDDYSITSDSLTELQGISELYERANNMPVWPFDLKTISNFIVAIALPIVIIYAEELLF